MGQTPVVTVLVSFASGGLAGSILSLIVGGCRDKRQRRRAFVGFLRSWRVEIANAPRIPGSMVLGPDRTPYYHMAQDRSFSTYQNKLPVFHAEIERVRHCFKDTKRFESLTIKLKTLKEENWQNKRDDALKAFDDLIDFI